MLNKNDVHIPKLDSNEDFLNYCCAFNPNISFLLDNNFIIKQVTPSLKEMLNRDCESLKGKNIFECGIMKKDSGMNAYYHLTELMHHSTTSTENPLLIQEVDFIDSKGNTQIFEVTAWCLKEDEAINGIYFSARDISLRKQTELELKQTLYNLRKSLEVIIKTISLTVESRDPYTAGHQRRVADLARSIAKEMGLSNDEIDGIRMSGAVHDLGKIFVPSEILSKPGKLHHIEMELIKIHPKIGFDILVNIDFPWPVAATVLQHHERINGTGYPYGIEGESIITEAKIIGVADVVEALASHRPYRAALGTDHAMKEINKNSGILYDPEVVDICTFLFNKKGYCFDSNSSL